MAGEAPLREQGAKLVRVGGQLGIGGGCPSCLGDQHQNRSKQLDSMGDKNRHRSFSGHGGKGRGNVATTFSIDPLNRHVTLRSGGLRAA